MKVLVYENNSSGTSSRFMVTDCLGKLFTGINIADSLSEKISQEQQSTVIRQQVVLRNYSVQMTEKIVFKIGPSPQKRKHLPYMEIVVASTKKRKGFPYKAGMNRL